MHIISVHHGSLVDYHLHDLNGFAENGSPVLCQWVVVAHVHHGRPHNVALPGFRLANMIVYERTGAQIYERISAR